MTEKQLKLNKFWITFLAISSIFIGFLEFHGIINSLIQSIFLQQNKIIKEDSLQATFNQQKQFHYKDLIFSSEIDSGNLQEVRKIGKNHFSLKIGTDPENSIEPKIFRNWFYFQVRGFYKEANFKFTINNLKYNWQMWKHGIVPVYRSKLQTDNKWKLLDKNPVKLFLKKKKMALEFEFNFKKNDIVEFAITFPYSYQKNKAFFKKAKKKFDQMKNIKFIKTLLIKSNLEKDIDFYWLHKDDDKSQQLSKISNLFPTEDYKKIKNNNKKCVIIISARVHPSETASSYLLEGFIDYLTNNENHTQQILNKCSIGIVPMLNPDGVQLGLTRTDSEGLDLNRHYDQADLQTPSIYALKKLMRYFDKKKLTFYFDFHSHFTKRGMFLFGNPLTKKNYKKILKYPIILKNNLQEFDLNSSSFGSDKDEATSRRELYKYTNLNKLYTVEVNYWGGKQQNKILKDKQQRQNNLRFIKNFKDFYKLKDFRHMGYQLGKTLNDYFNLSKKIKREDRKKINLQIENFYLQFNKQKKKKKIRKQKKIGKIKKPIKKNSLFN